MVRQAGPVSPERDSRRWEAAKHSGPARRIVYYEPRKVLGTRGYFAVAKDAEIISDAALGGYVPRGDQTRELSRLRHSRALLRAYRPIIKRGMLSEAGRISGRAQSAVRPLSPADFNRIVKAGLPEQNPVLPRIGAAETTFGVQEDRTPFLFDEVRERVAALVSRVVQDRVFRRVLLRPYDERCAVAGLKLINGGAAPSLKRRISGPSKQTGRTSSATV